MSATRARRRGVGGLLAFATDDERQEIERLAKLIGEPTADGGEGHIAKTIDEAARLLGVDCRTISRWQTDPSFPGKPGCRGRASAYYPIEAIRRWRAERFRAKGDGTDDTARRRELNARAGLKELEFERLAAGLIDVKDVQRIADDMLSQAASLLERLPQDIGAEIGGTTRPKTRRHIERAATRHIRKVLEALEPLRSVRAVEAYDEESDEQ